jgi:hypothetical protein
MYGMNTPRAAELRFLFETPPPRFFSTESLSDGGKTNEKLLWNSTPVSLYVSHRVGYTCASEERHHNTDISTVALFASIIYLQLLSGPCQLNFLLKLESLTPLKLPTELTVLGHGRLYC